MNLNLKFDMFDIVIKKDDKKLNYNIPDSYEILFSDHDIFSETRVRGRITNFNEINSTLFNMSQDFNGQNNFEIFLYKDDILVFKTYLNQLTYSFSKNKDEKDFNEVIRFLI